MQLCSPNCTCRRLIPHCRFLHPRHQTRQHCCIKKQRTEEPQGAEFQQEEKNNLFFLSICQWPLSSAGVWRKNKFSKHQNCSAVIMKHTQSAFRKKIQWHKLNVLFIHCAAWRFEAASVEFERLQRRQQIPLLDKQSAKWLYKRGAKHFELDPTASQTTHSHKHLSPRSEVTKCACRQDDWCSCCRPLTLSLFFPMWRRHLKQNHQPQWTLIQMSSKFHNSRSVTSWAPTCG